MKYGNKLKWNQAGTAAQILDEAYDPRNANDMTNCSSGPPFDVQRRDYELQGPNFYDEKGERGVLHTLLTQVVKDGGMAYGKIMVLYPKGSAPKEEL